MENVYDLVDDFYKNDEGWNTVLRQEYAEGYLRKQAWHGASDARLKEEWGYILMLIIYLGQADCYLGDLSVDDLVDAVAWCGRNVTDFTVAPANVKRFLEVLGNLFVYLKNKHAISSSIAPHLAKAVLLRDDGTLAVIDSTGEFLPGEQERAEYATPDAPSKVFLNIGEVLGSLLEELHNFFQKDIFNFDLERAVFFYHGFFSNEKLSIEAESEEFWQCFWDYFLFDYHLIVDDKTPLQHFAEQHKSKYQELLTELCESRLAVFSIVDNQDGDFYLCRDFLTNEEYVLNLPLEAEVDQRDLLIIGHIFYNKTMVMNYIRCFQINKIARKRLREQLDSFYAWFKIQEPAATMTDFIARHPMVIRRLTYYVAHCFNLTSFSYQTAVKDYQPTQSARTDEVAKCIEKMLVSQHFSRRDIYLTTRLWKDFSAVDTNAIKRPEVWASGVIENYIQLNRVYSYSPESIADLCWHIPVQTLKVVADRIKEKLHIEEYDPRYCNEEGFLMMMFAKKK